MFRSQTRKQTRLIHSKLFNLPAPYFDISEATSQYLNKLNPDEKERSDRYFGGGYWHLLWGLLVEIVVAFVFLSLGLSRWIRKISMKVKNINLQNLIYILLYLIFAFIISLPYSIYVGFIREHKFGLSNMSFGAWFGEEITSLAVSLVLMGILLVFIYAAIRKTKEKWWIWAGFISIVFLIIILFISPIFIAPLFNKYTDLEEGELKSEILSLARANGIPTNHVYQFNASKQTKSISANVSGFGKTIRISLNDNLLNRCSDAEIRAVMAHEMGHYVLHHIYRFILTFGILIFLGFWLIHKSFHLINTRRKTAWNINGLSDISGLPLFVILFSVYIFFATPVYNNIIRSAEIEADVFGLNASREPDGFAKAIMMTSEYRKVAPGKWEEIIFYDHPSPKTRIETAMRWKKENILTQDSAFNE